MLLLGVGALIFCPLLLLQGPCLADSPVAPEQPLREPVLRRNLQPLPVSLSPCSLWREQAQVWGGPPPHHTVPEGGAGERRSPVAQPASSSPASAPGCKQPLAGHPAQKCCCKTCMRVQARPFLAVTWALCSLSLPSLYLILFSLVPRASSGQPQNPNRMLFVL